MKTQQNLFIWRKKSAERPNKSMNMDGSYHPLISEFSKLSFRIFDKEWLLCASAPD